MDIEPEWTLEAAADPARVVRDPDPKSRAAYTRLIGYSAGAAFVVTVIIDPEDFSGVTVPMHLRIDRELDEQLRRQANGEGIPISALVRRLLRQATQQGSAPFSQTDIENIARRIAREELQSH